MSNLYLVTGVSSGIGFAIAELLLHQGHKIVGVSRSCSDNVKVLKKNFADSFVHESRDLSEDIDSLPKWVIGLSKIHGRFSGFVHAAGVLQVLPLRFNSQQKMLDIFTLNVFSALQIAKGIADKRVKHEDGASIIFIASIAANSGATGTINYSASKGALISAMKSMAKELSPDGIRVNSISPGLVKTDMTLNLNSESFFARMEQQYPLGLGGVEDIAEAASYLISCQSKWITGTDLIVDGGITLGINE
ncbi:SDR family NAD(P)-dependent oxidoreductase [Pseudoalteromonas sp. XMcav1-K]|uniref:SDR family NAD(P)-dependent oxidoreductase n=1 Tax=Pseudoalteromonas sp. XMcav1-K TaxID=3374372 RepID=UPI0037576357